MNNAHTTQPGDTLLRVTAEGVVCPGCHATSPTSVTLQHEDGCAIARTIERALSYYDVIGTDPYGPEREQ